MSYSIATLSLSHRSASRMPRFAIREEDWPTGSLAKNEQLSQSQSIGLALRPSGTMFGGGHETAVAAARVGRPGCEPIVAAIRSPVRRVLTATGPAVICLITVLAL